MKKKTIIGLGNPLKKDDNIGNLIVDKLKEQIQGPDYIFIKAGISPENFLVKIKKQDPDLVLFVDAACFDGTIGEVKLFDISDMEEYQFSTHNIPISLFRERLKSIKIIGIKVEDTDFGQGLSKDLQKRFDLIFEAVRSLVISL